MRRSNILSLNLNFLPALCISFCLGITFIHCFKIPFFILYLPAAIIAAMIFLFQRRNRNFDMLILFFAFFLGAVWMKSSYNLARGHIARFISYKSEQVLIKGTVISDPVKGENRTLFVLQAEELENSRIKLKVCGNIQVLATGRRDFSYGQGLILSGILRRPPNFAARGRSSYRKYLYQQGIYAVLNLSKNTPVKYLAHNQGHKLVRLSFWFRHKMEERIAQNLNFLSASILKAMVLGDARDVPDFVNQAMIRTGTIHILVVSGFNVGIVAFIVLLALKAMRIPRRPRYILAIMILIFYCLITGASVPVVRATIMGLAILIGYLINRETDIYNSLSLAGLAILCFNPRQLFNIGFQLSFASVLAIVFLYPKIYRLFPARLKKFRYIDWLIAAFSLSLSAWLGTSGLIAYYFGIFNPIAILANMIIAPYASLITVCGISLVAISFLLPQLTHLFGATSQLCVVALLKFNLLLDRPPHAFLKIDLIPLGWILLYYACLILIAFYLPNVIMVLPRYSVDRRKEV